MLNIREGKKEKERDRKRKKKERQKEEQKKKERKKEERNKKCYCFDKEYACLFDPTKCHTNRYGWFEMTQHTTCIYVHVITGEKQFGEN